MKSSQTARNRTSRLQSIIFLKLSTSVAFCNSRQSCERSLAGAEAEAVTLSPVARLLTKLSPFKGCSRSPLSLALGARANCRTSSLCSPDWWCNKTYLCFQKCRSNGNDDTGRHIWRMVEPEFPSCISLFTFPIADIQVSDLYSHSSSIHSVTRASWTRQACSSHCKHMNTWRGGDKMTICTRTKHNHVLDRATCQVISGGSTSYFFCGLNPRYQDHLSVSYTHLRAHET